MGQLRLTDPVIITSRLLPGVRAGDGFISIQRAARPTSSGRVRFHYWIDLPDGTEYTDSSLTSPRPSLQDALSTLLTFLAAAGESHGYHLRTGREGENGDMFPQNVNEWAYDNNDELASLALELDETPGLIEEVEGATPNADTRSVADILDERQAKAEQGNWVPASGGTEQPFVTRTRRRLQYLYQPSTGKHAYIDLDTDTILDEEDARAALGMYNNNRASGMREHHATTRERAEELREAVKRTPPPAGDPAVERASIAADAKAVAATPNAGDAGKRVDVYVETVTEESAAEGDVESTEEEGSRQVSSVAEAARFIIEHGGSFEPSSSDFTPGVWYKSEPQQDQHTGAYTSYTLVPRGFALGEERKLYALVAGRKR